jgi:hypothetical protein
MVKRNHDIVCDGYHPSFEQEERWTRTHPNKHSGAKRFAAGYKASDGATFAVI